MAEGRLSRLERAIAGQLRRLRRAHGLTLAETAARTGISAPMLSKIENASISCSLSTLDRIAEAFDVPVTALFRGADTLREAVYTPAGPARASPRAAPAWATTTPWSAGCVARTSGWRPTSSR